jgi:hypothetical protein
MTTSTANPIRPMIAVVSLWCAVLFIEAITPSIPESPCETPSLLDANVRQGRSCSE